MPSLLVLLILCLSLQATRPVQLWSAPHTSAESTLRLLQIVHRHGDRNINVIYPNDPFNNITHFWPEGLGELTARGKLQMYRFGQFIRQKYQNYLGLEYNPREVYVRSSAKNRCLESVSCFLAAAYPPNNTKWQWSSGLGSLWQPFPIETFYPMDDDRLLRTETYCPKATQEMDAIERSDFVQKQLRQEMSFLKNLSQLIGFDIKTTLNCNNIYNFLTIEYNKGLKWSDFGRWTPQYERQIFEKLKPFSELLWKTEWNSSLVQRTRAGPLIGELVANMKAATNRRSSQSQVNRKKVFVYSTHDAVIGVLLHSFQVFNGLIIPISSSLIFELHQKPNTNEYFVRIYYLNETEPEFRSHLLQLPKCNNSNDCPTDTFFSLSQQLIPDDWQLECGLTPTTQPTNVVLTFANVSLLALNAVLLTILVIVLSLTLCYQTKRRKSYQSFD